MWVTKLYKESKFELYTRFWCLCESNCWIVEYLFYSKGPILMAPNEWLMHLTCKCLYYTISNVFQPKSAWNMPVIVLVLCLTKNFFVFQFFCRETMMGNKLNFFFLYCWVVFGLYYHKWTSRYFGSMHVHALKKKWHSMWDDLPEAYMETF